MLIPDTFTIDRSDFPSGKFNVTLRTPRFADWRKARKLYPVETDAQGNRKSPGYGVEELLICDLLVDITDKDGNSYLNKKPKDLIDHLMVLEIPDRQALTSIFLSIFWVSPQQAKAAKALANEYLVSAALTYCVNADQLPMSDEDVSYNMPNVGTQMAADRRYQGVQEQGCTLEEMLLAMCLHTIDGVPVEPAKDIISVLDDWYIADVQFVNLVFINQFTLDDTKEEEAKAAGKRYLEKFGTKPLATTPAVKAPSKSTVVTPDS